MKDKNVFNHVTNNVFSGHSYCLPDGRVFNIMSDDEIRKFSRDANRQLLKKQIALQYKLDKQFALSFQECLKKPEPLLFDSQFDLFASVDNT